MFQELIEAERKRLPDEVFRAQFLMEFVGVPVEPCDERHGPSAGNSTLLMFVDDEEPGTCPACSRPTDEDGQSIVPLRPDGTEGEPRIIRIRPDAGAVEPPELP